MSAAHEAAAWRTGMKIPTILRIYLSVYLVTLILICGYFLFFTDAYRLIRDERVNAAVVFSDGWTDDRGQTVDLEEVNTRDYGGVATFTKMLPPSIKPNDEFCFITANSNVTVWIDDVLSYEFIAQKNITGMGYGKAYHTVNLGSLDEGKEITVRLAAVFKSGAGGRIVKIRLCEAPVFRLSVLKGSFIPFILSIFIMVSGILIIILRQGIPKNQKLPYNLVALGASLTIAGVWLIGDTAVFQVMLGHVRFWRGIEYLLLLFSITPTLSFALSFVKKQRGIFVHTTFLMPFAALCIMFFTRFVLDIDMSRYGFVVYIAYGLTLALMIVIAVDNEIYCRKNNISPNLRSFYIGGGAFLIGAVIDICIVAATYKNKVIPSRGYFMRIGITVLVITMLIRITRWWSNESSTIARDRFINKILQYSLASSDADVKLNLVMEYLGREFNADRAYVFEEVANGVFDNTYEWCKKDVSSQIHNLKGLPYEGVVDSWYEEYKKNNSVLIYDLEEYKNVSLNMYNVLKPQGINTLITAPLEANGRYIGFFGVDNPPVDAMNEIREILRLLAYFISQLLQEKQYENKLVYYSYYDSLTGVRNRRAITEFESEELDASKPYGFIMCDVNGLKIMNDTLGHEAGDALLTDVAKSLVKAFGNTNVYRVGGDEFAIYDCESDKTAFFEKVAQAREYISNLGRSVSLGCVYEENGNPDYEAAKTEADKIMYVEKQKYYEGRHDRRRV